MFVTGLPYPVRMRPEGMVSKSEGIDIVGPPHGPHTEVTRCELVATESPGRGTVGHVEIRKYVIRDTILTVLNILVCSSPLLVHALYRTGSHQNF